MKCTKCGTQLDPEARFCGVCGTPVLAAPPPQVAPGGEVPSTVRLKSGVSAPATQPPRAQSAPSPLVRPVSTPVGIAPVPGDAYIGKTLNGRYLVESKLGEGGFGAVYKARQVQIGRQVALKVLHPDTARDPNLVARFRREGAVACSLKDAHTITTYDFDQTAEGVLYIAMELLTGRSLHEVFHNEAPIAWTRVLSIIEQMCSSLGEAHVTGIVHRDLKPENIYLEPRPGNPEFVKILDFGIAKIVGGEIGQNSPQLTASGQTLGTLEYMSPEQLMGKQLDGRSDIYAMGVLAYELLTGRLPFPDANGPAALIGAQLKKTPPPPSAARADARIPAPVDQLVLKMLEKDRDKRHADVGALAQACHALLATAPQPMPAAPQVTPVAQVPVAAAAYGNLPPPAVPPPAVPAPRVAAGTGGPSTEALVKESRGSRTWLWIALAALVIGGVLTAVLVLKK
jgi:serine/threonine protein kinase